MLAKEASDIALKVSLFIMPLNCNVPQSTLYAPWGTSGKAEKSHRAKDHAMFARFRGSNSLIFLITSFANALMSALSSMHNVAQDHAIPVRCWGANSEHRRRAEEAIESMKGW